MPGSFFDSNVLLYLASNDPRKAQRSEELLLKGGTISVQVLNEIAHVGRHKIRMSWIELRDLLGLVRRKLRVVPLTTKTHDLGLTLAQRHGFSTYDAMIVAAASMDGCDTLWSEDMHNGLQIVGGPLIADPFYPIGR